MHAPLTRDLEREPLQLDVLVLTGARQLMVLVVLVDQIHQDRQSLPGLRSAIDRWDGHREDLPNDKVVVMMVDDGGDATVWVDLQVIWSLMLALAEVEVDSFVCQSQFLENDGGFPGNRIDFETAVILRGGENRRTSRWVHCRGRTK